MAVEAFKDGLSGAGTTEERLASRAREANRQIFDLASTQQDRAGMGTTLTAAYLDGSELAIAHVGDSRAYLFRGGSLTRLTQDHSLVDELVRRGKLSEEEAAEHPQRSIITRALGPEPTVDVDTWTYPVRGGDVLLLCSDGLTSMVTEEQVAKILGESEGLEATAQALIDEANRAGGRDNITVVLARLEEVEPGTDADGSGEHPTVVGAPTVAQEAADAPTRPAGAPASGAENSEAPTAPTTPAEAPQQGKAMPAGSASATLARPSRIRRGALTLGKRRRRFSRPVALLLAVVIVLCLIGAGGYLASRQLYFIGTNSQGMVTVYRGLPYDLPAGIHLYETFYVSGVPATLVPSDRRAALFDDSLRSQSSAANTVRQLELGRISK
jgi:protein phosphatase